MAALVAAIYAITCTLFSKNGSHKGCRYKNIVAKHVMAPLYVPTITHYVGPQSENTAQRV